jgi:hypothetical protein
MRPAKRHEGSWSCGPKLAPAVVQGYADAVSILFSNKIAAPLRRLARRAMDLVTGGPGKEAQTATEWLARNVPSWSQAKLVKLFRRTAVRLPQGYCPVPFQFKPLDAAARLQCFAILSDELKRRAREFNNTARAQREISHSAAFKRPVQKD